MSGENTDRRVRRTRLTLQNALVELIGEKGYESITVQDILDRADVGRSTFYAHFRDKDELLLSGFERLGPMFDAHRQSALDGSGIDNMPAALLRHMDENRALFKALLGKRSGAMLFSHVEEYLSDYAQEVMSAHLDGAKPGMPAEVVARFAASSFLTMAIWWIESSAPYSPDEMAGMLTALIERGTSAAMPGFRTP